MSAVTKPNDSMPTLFGRTRYSLRASQLRLQRGLTDRKLDIVRLPNGISSDFPHLIATSRSKLWTETGAAERRLQLGKVQNIRIAAQALNNIELDPGMTFSFWKQVGRATRLRGFTNGRQLQEGCIVPAIGGGLCQISNALYDVALKADCKITERHPHTRIVPGSLAEQDRDATVAWNYVDLRFNAPRPMLLTVQLTATELIVSLRGKEPAHQALQLSPTKSRPTLDPKDHSCESCEVTACFVHAKLDRRGAASGKAYLVDEVWPEFAAYLKAEAKGNDQLFAPMRGRNKRYEWPTEPFSEAHYATLQTLRRAWISRRLAGQGAQRQQALLDGARRLAESYARALDYETEALVIAHPLLPFLWQMGVLGGRTFDVLLTRPPIAEIQRTLDAAAQQFPDRSSLADFRADQSLIQAESEALNRADRLITPHRTLAAHFGPRAILLEWQTPSVAPVSRQPSNTIVFPGPTVARKGAWEVREAARILDLEVLTLGSELEGANFWEGVRQRRVQPGENWLAQASAVVQPALLEDKPRPLLRALAAQIPVVATQACGIAATREVAFGDPGALIEALKSLDS